MSLRIQICHSGKSVAKMIVEVLSLFDRFVRNPFLEVLMNYKFFQSFNDLYTKRMALPLQTLFYLVSPNNNFVCSGFRINLPDYTPQISVLLRQIFRNDTSLTYSVITKFSFEADFIHKKSPGNRGFLNFDDLLHHDHFSGLRVIRSFQLVEIYTACDFSSEIISTVPNDMICTGSFFLIDESCNFVSEYVIYFQ